MPQRLARDESEERRSAFGEARLPVAARPVAVARPALAALLLLATPARAEPPSGHAIPPGNEAVISLMLGDAAPLPGGCKAEELSVQRDFILARYRCAATVGALELRHRDAPVEAVATTAQFKLVQRGALPPSLIEAVAGRVWAHEAAFRWVSVEERRLEPAATAAPPPATGADEAAGERGPPAPRGRSDDNGDAPSVPIADAAQLWNERGAHAALAALTSRVAVDGGQASRASPLALLMAAIESSGVDIGRVDALIAEAEAAPDDALAQLSAGMAAFSFATNTLRDRVGQQRMYQHALRYLTRARSAPPSPTGPSYDREPQLLLHLALAAYRLGLQSDAETLYEELATLENVDPTTAYWEAEIFQQRDRPRARRALEKYRAYLASLARPGQPADPRIAAVSSLLARLAPDASDAIEQAGPLLDPFPFLEEPAKAAHRAPPPDATDPALPLFAVAALALGALFAGLFFVLFRRRG